MELSMSIRRPLFTTIVAMILQLHLQPVQAQTEIADYGRVGYAAFLTSTVTDYQCVSINPANLGFAPVTDVFAASTPIDAGVERSRRSFAVGIAQGGVSIRSDALNKTRLLDLLYQRGSATKFTPEDQLQAASEFAGKGVRFNIDMLVFGLSYQSKRFGGFALTVRERANATFRLNEGASQIIFQGRRAEYFDSSYTNWRGDTIGVSRSPKPFSQLFEGTRLSLSWMREWGLSYGVPVWIDGTSRINLGVTGKFLQPYAYLDANATGTDFIAHSALSPWFGINYGNARTPSQIEGNAFVPIGNGYAGDIGVSYQSPTLSVGISVIDIGSVTYNGNVYSAADTIVNGLGTTGFGSYNLFEEAPKITGEGNYFVWNGLMTTTSRLPTRLRVGSNYRFMNRFEIGVDFTLPIADVGTNTQNVIATAGLNFRPFPWLTLATGIGSGDGMEVFIPGSICLSLFGGTWEVGVSSIDISTLFTDRLPVVSANVGFLRFRI
jgi:hypothetical protein